MNPIEGYLSFQLYCSFFRALSICLGSVVLSLVYRVNTDSFLGIKSKVGILFLPYLIFYFAIHLLSFTPSLLKLEYFLYEIFFNIFVGFFEEIIFRGLIFLGLYRWLGFWRASLITSFLFALWHLDVISDKLDYIYLFTFSIVFCLAMAKGVSLLILSIVHFLIDQIHYGLIWKGEGGLSWYMILISFHILSLFVFYLVKDRKISNLNRREIIVDKENL